MTSLPPPLTIRTLSRPSVNTSKNSMSENKRIECLFLLRTWFLLYFTKKLWDSLILAFFIKKIFIQCSVASKVIQGHIRPLLLCQNNSSTFVYWPISMKICKNANIMKTQRGPLISKAFIVKCIYSSCQKYYLKKIW